MQKQHQQMTENLQQTGNRWRKALQTNCIWDSVNGNIHYFPDINLTQKTLRQILKLSETQQGCQFIYKAQFYLINSYLIPNLFIYWTKSSHYIFDNLALRIIPNLMKYPVYYHEAFANLNRFKELNDRQKFPNIFAKMCKQVYQSMKIAAQKYIDSIPVEKYKNNFKNKEQALDQLKRIREKWNFLNFSISCTQFEKQYQQYIKVLEECIQYDLKSQIVQFFPKNCYGCVIFAMIVSSNRVKNPQIAIRFLKKMTNGWFNQIIYYFFLQKIKSLYRKLKYNQNLTDKSQLVCLRFTQYDSSIFQWLQSQQLKRLFENKYNEKAEFQQITSKYQIQQKFNKIRNKQILDKQK